MNKFRIDTEKNVKNYPKPPYPEGFTGKLFQIFKEQIFFFHF